MAHCIKCGEFFQPTADEDRLLATHQMEEICMACALEQSQDSGTDWKPSPMFVPAGKFDGTKLYRAEWLDKDEKLICFVAVPIERMVRAHGSLIKPRRGTIRVTIITSSDAHRMSSQPPVIVHTNVDSFERTRTPFWVSKTPSYWDPQTGVGRIEIPRINVDHVSEDVQKKEVHLKDGGVVYLTYK